MCVHVFMDYDKVEELRAKAAHRVESKQHSSYYSAVSSHPSTRRVCLNPFVIFAGEAVLVS